MPYLPELPTWEKSIINTQQFLGLNRGLSIADGEMADMLNMSSDNFPVLSTRQPRGVPEFHPSAVIENVLDGKIDGMMGTDSLIVCHDGKVYLDGVEVPIELSKEASKREKKLVSMGAYVCIWPDKKYFNVNDINDCGDMGRKWQATDEPIEAMMCRRDGTDYDTDTIVSSDTPPTDPEDGEYWLDMSGEKDVLKQFSKLHNQWVQVATTYIKIQSPGIGKGLKDMDVVWLSGAAIDAKSTDPIEPGTINIKGADVELVSTMTVRYNGEGHGYTILSGPTSDKKVIKIKVEGLPYGGAVDSAYLTFTASLSPNPMDKSYVSTMNGMEFGLGEQRIPVDIKSTGEFSIQFVFSPERFIINSAGTHYIRLNITNLSLTVNYVPANLSDHEADVDQVNDLNTSNIVYGCGDDYIIVAGLLHRKLTFHNTLKLEMKVPDLDYVCEANNRIWGCVYSQADGEVVNEIRGCALGDFRNWDKYIGTAADSYTVSVGSDGVFTGAYSLQGVPIFYKEAFMHRVGGTIPANFTLNTIRCRGVQNGSWKSLAVVNETLFYKARNEIMAYEGALPYSVSAKLGHADYRNAVAGNYRDKYYINMQDASTLEWHTYVLDATKGVWHQEDKQKISNMATISGELVLAVEGDDTTSLRTVGNKGGTNEYFPWSVTFGVLGFQSEQQKYLSRYNIRAQMSAGSHMKVEMQYDSDGKWVHMGTMKSPRMQTFLLPIIPRRCDHCQLRISGNGTINIYSVAREYENGGDG